jgi:hypothetical protein
MFSKVFKRNRKDSRDMSGIDGRVKFIVRRDDTILGKLAIINDDLVLKAMGSTELSDRDIMKSFPSTAAQELQEILLCVAGELYFSCREMNEKNGHDLHTTALEPEYLAYKVLVFGELYNLVCAEGHSLDVSQGFKIAAINIAIEDIESCQSIALNAIEIHNAVIEGDQSKIDWRRDLKNHLDEYIRGWDIRAKPEEHLNQKSVFSTHFQSLHELMAS